MIPTKATSMTLDHALRELSVFVNTLRPCFPSLQLTTPRPLDARTFPDELDAVKPPSSGLYILVRQDNNQLLDVGISNDMADRIYKHIGKGFTWARAGAHCSFPHMQLAEGRPWLSEQTQALLRRGDFQIQIVGVQPVECSALLESFLIVHCLLKEGHKPEINVEL